MTDRAILAIAYAAGQAEYSRTVTTREALHARIVRRTAQTRFNRALGMRGTLGTRAAS